MKIKDQIRTRREARGLTKQQLAEKLEVSVTAVDHWEAGRNQPNRKKIEALESALDFQLDLREGADLPGNLKTAMDIIGESSASLVYKISLLPADGRKAIEDLVDSFTRAAGLTHEPEEVERHVPAKRAARAPAKKVTAKTRR